MVERSFGEILQPREVGRIIVDVRMEDDFIFHCFLLGAAVKRPS
ncbi:hypothetical protein ABIE88_003465 [Bradyrhizobium diazoefficiens]